MEPDIRPAGDQIAEHANRILRALPDWFGLEEPIVEFVEKIPDQIAFEAHHDDDVVGFMAVEFNNEFTAEIPVMGILTEYHRQGIGRALVERAEQATREGGGKLLEVKTLGPSRSDEHYDRTRAFYLDCGFIPVQEFKEVWGPDNPCLVLVKPL